MNSQKILQQLTKLRIIRMFHGSPSPRWITFLADFVIVAICSALIFMLSPHNQPKLLTDYGYIIMLAVYTFTNLITGNYKCIIRFSVTDDMLKTFFFVALSCIILCTTSFCFSLVSSSHYFLIPIPSILITSAIILCALVLLRLTVKTFYNHISAVLKERKPVIVLGSAINSFSLASSLRDEVNGEFEPKALLSLNKNINVKKINGLPVEIFDKSTVRDVFAKYNCQTLIFLQNHLDMMQNGFADIFMDNGITLKILHQVEEFDINDNASEDVKISSHVQEIKIEDLLCRPVITNTNPRIARQVEGKRVLITGAAGSIGSEIVRQVAAFNAGEIILLDQAETPMHDMQLEMENTWPGVKIHLYVADVQNVDRLERAFAEYRPQIVYHAAAYKHVPMMERNPTEAILTNVMGTKNLADLATKYNVEKFVMISTDKAVNPTNIMGASKRIAEIYVQSLYFHVKGDNSPETTKYVTTRFGNVLGSNGSVIPLFRRQIAAGGPVTLTHRDIIRYFMTIREACSLVLEAGCMSDGGEIYIFDMGEPVKIYDLAKRMIILSGLKPDIDIKIIETGLRPGEKLYEELLNDKEKTLPTSNDKIMIAKVRRYDFKEICTMIDRLISHASKGNIHDMVHLMKEIVPEYKSKNSKFESIDREISAEQSR